MATLTETDVQPVPLTRTNNGGWRIEGTRIPLERVIVAFRGGASAESIVEQFPSLDLSAVYATIAYYLTHRAEVDDYVAGSNEDWQDARLEAERRHPDNAEFKARLLARFERPDPR